MTPFYRIIRTRDGLDITDLVSSFSYEQSLEKDDQIILAIQEKNRLKVLDDLVIDHGDQISFDYGFVGTDLVSGQRTASVTGLPRKYNQKVLRSLRVFASDQGLQLKRNNPFTYWSGVTASQIATQIAEKNGMLSEVEPTTHQYENMPQAGRSDFSFLKYLASIENSGLYRVFVQGNKLFFTKRDLSRQSSRTININDEIFLDLDVPDQEINRDGGSKSTTVATTDKKTGDLIEYTADGTNDNDNKLGDYTYHFNANGEEVAVKASQAQKARNNPNVGKRVVGGIQDNLQARHGAEHRKQKAALGDIKAVLMLRGTPDIEIEQILTLEGFGKRDNGNWYVVAVRHEITVSKSFITTVELRKNAVDSKNSKGGNTRNQSSKVNKSKGEKDGDKRKDVKLISFDGNGNELG